MVSILLAIRPFFYLILVLVMVATSPMDAGFASEDEVFGDDAFDTHGSVMLVIEASTGSIVKANRAASDFYGYLPSELLGMRVDEINMLLPAEVEEERQAAVSEQRNYFVFPHRLRNGEVRTVEVYSYPINSEGLFVLSIVHDITARIEAEQTLRDYNRRLKRAEDITGIGHWEFHFVDNRVVVSEGAKQVYGLIGDEWTISDVQAIPLPEHRVILDTALANLLEKGEHYDVEFQIRRPIDGQIADIRSIAEYDEDRNVVFGTLMDVTEYHQLLRLARKRRDTVIAIVSLLLLVSIVGIFVLVRLLYMRRQSEAQLAASMSIATERDRQLTHLMNNIPGMVYRCHNDRHWTMLFVSSGVEELLGYTPDDLVHNNKISYMDLILPEYHDYLWNAWQGVLEDRQPLVAEYRIRTASGSVKWVWEQGCGVYDENGELLLLEGLVIDITALKEAEEGLRRREQDLAVTLHSIGDAVITTDINGNITRMNPVAEALTGWTSSEALGRPLTEVFEIISTITRQPHLDPVSMVLESGQIVGLANHTSLIARDGTEYQIADSAAPIVDVDGKMLGVVLVFHDVTQMYEQRQALADRERQYRELFEYSLDAIAVHRLVLDDDGNPQDYVFLQTNTAFEKHTGLYLADIIGKRVSEIYPDIRQSGLIEIYGRVVLTGEPVTFETYFEPTQRFYYISAYAVGQDRFATVFEDITERKLAEDALRKSAQLLQDTQRLAKVGGWEWDVKRQSMTWTEETYHIHGVNPVNIPVGSPEHMNVSLACYAPADQQMIKGAFQRCLDTGEGYDLEFPFTTVTGQARWVRTVAYGVLDDSGNVIKVIGNIMDITERKQAEIELQDSETRFRQLVELAPDAIFVETEGTFSYVNNAALELFGAVTEKDLLGRPVLGQIAPEHQEIVAERLHKLDVERQAVPRNEEAFLQLDGTPVYVEVAAVPILFQSKWGALVYARDITERKSAEAQLHYLTFHDPVTDLYNRTFLEEKLKGLDTESQLPLGLMMADVDGLKIINDSLGHQQGDRLLQRVADILKTTCRPKDIIGRWGGDEFVAILPQTTGLQLRNIASRIEKACEESASAPFSISLAVGYAVKEKIEQDIDVILRRAEDSMYQRKMNKALSNKSALVASLQRALGEKSHETEHHARRLQELAVALGKRYGLSDAQLDEVSLLALLHDIGKVAVSEEILNKQGPLSPAEQEIIRKHPEIGYRIAAASPDLVSVAQGILSHHERWDGGGYPRGLKGKDIPLSARIVTLVDAFEAMISDRPYSQGISVEEALREITACAGTQFDPVLARLFVEMIEAEAADTDE